MAVCWLNYENGCDSRIPAQHWRLYRILLKYFQLPVDFFGDLNILATLTFYSKKTKKQKKIV